MNPDGTQDTNTVSLYETSNGQSLTYDTIDGRPGTATLKVTSHATGIRAKANYLIGGTENVVDVNNEVDDLVVDCETYLITGKYGVSSKTSNNVTFRGRFVGRPTQWHVNLGSWSDQSKRKQTNTRLEFTADVYPILVWVGNSDLPVLDDPAKYKLIGVGTYGSVVRILVMLGWSLIKTFQKP